MINPLIISSYLVEDCHKLRLGDLGKHLLAPAKTEQCDDFDKQIKIGKSGTALLLNGLNLMKVEYQINLNLAPNIINVKFYNSKKMDSGINQTIEIQKQELLFGTRFFFKCRCGKRLNMLYLRPDMPYYFACRKCLNLRYFLTTINRKIIGKEIFYWFNRNQKVKEKIAGIKQFTRKGKPTKKASAVLHYANKYNLSTNTVAMAMIKNQMSRLGVA